MLGYPGIRDPGTCGFVRYLPLLQSKVSRLTQLGVKGLKCIKQLTPQHLKLAFHAEHQTIHVSKVQGTFSCRASHNVANPERICRLLSRPHACTPHATGDGRSSRLCLRGRPSKIRILPRGLIALAAAGTVAAATAAAATTATAAPGAVAAVNRVKPELHALSYAHSSLQAHAPRPVLKYFRHSRG